MGVNRAEGEREAQILASESEKIEKVNQAQGEAQAILAKAQAKAKAIELVGNALNSQQGSSAASLQVAEQYVKAFGNLAKEGNTILPPSNAGDVSSMVAQAVSIYSNMSPAAPKDTIVKKLEDHEDKKTVEEEEEVKA